MSYVISSSQRLAVEENCINFHNIAFNVDGVDITRYNVGFGQPLYTIASDIISFCCTSNGGAVLPVLPGCGITIAFIGRGEDYETYACGPNNELRKINMEHGDTVILFRFLPGAAASLLSCSINEIADKAVRADGVLRGSKQINGFLRREMELDEKIKDISSVIRTYILQTPENEIVKYCIERIYEVDGNVRIEDLSQETDVTSRYIGKLFEKNIGLSPKYFAEMIKINNAVEKIMNNKDQRLTDIAAECGYFDHTHMNKMLRKAFHTSSGKISQDMFNETDYSEIENYITVM